jgi:hypothetical protein
MDWWILVNFITRFWLGITYYYHPSLVSFSELENDTLNQAELNEIKLMKTIKY